MVSTGQTAENGGKENPVQKGNGSGWGDGSVRDTLLQKPGDPGQCLALMGTAALAAHTYGLSAGEAEAGGLRSQKLASPANW